MPLIDVPTVHAVTDDRILATDGFSERAAKVMRALGPAGAIHLRGAMTPAARLFELARALAPLQRETGGWIVVNDRVDVAQAVRARGVQLKTRSLALEDARAVAPAALFGVSVHDNREARLAKRADWLLAGNVNETASHPGRAARGESFVRSVVGLGTPVIAIGGILPEHVPRLRELGVWGVAAIRGIWTVGDPATEAVRYL